LSPPRLTQRHPVLPTDGDVLLIKTRRPFDSQDAFTLKTEAGKLNVATAASRLDNIYVVPNPYVGLSSIEPANPLPGQSRGERRVYFENLPPKCTIRIFTVSGDHVQTLTHESAWITGANTGTCSIPTGSALRMASTLRTSMHRVLAKRSSSWQSLSSGGHHEFPENLCDSSVHQHGDHDCLCTGTYKTGTTAAQFLKIGVGSRAVGMGGAFTATADDITAIYWNPGGLAAAGGNEAVFNHVAWFADMKYDFAA